MRKPLAGDGGGAQLLPGEERRRSQRVMVRVPVTIELTLGGQKVSFAGVTVSVNDHGAMLSCTRSISIGTTLELKNDRSGKIQTCRLTRAAVENQQGYLIPVEFVASAPGFWGISFPPTNWKPLED